MLKLKVSWRIFPTAKVFINSSRLKPFSFWWVCGCFVGTSAHWASHLHTSPKLSSLKHHFQLSQHPVPFLSASPRGFQSPPQSSLMSSSRESVLFLKGTQGLAGHFFIGFKKPFLHSHACTFAYTGAPTVMPSPTSLCLIKLSPSFNIHEPPPKRPSPTCHLRLSYLVYIYSVPSSELWTAVKKSDKISLPGA